MRRLAERISRESQADAWPNFQAAFEAAGRISYAREEPAGGPLLKGRRKCGATSAGELYPTPDVEPSLSTGASKDTATAVSPIGALPLLQSPRQLHWCDSLSLC